MQSFKKIMWMVFITILSIFLISFAVKKSTEHKLCSAVIDSSKVENYKRIDMLNGLDGNFYILISANSMTHVFFYNLGSDSCSYKGFLRFEYISAKSINNKIYILRAEGDENYPSTSVYQYSIAENASTSDCELIPEKVINLPKIKILTENNFEVYLDESESCNLLFIDEADYSKIMNFNIKSGNISNILYNEKEFKSITLNSSKDKLYAMTFSNEYICFDVAHNFLSTKLDPCPETFCKFLKDDIIVSESNVVYSVDDKGINKKLTLENISGKNLNCIFKTSQGEYILNTYDGGIINCYDATFKDLKNTPNKKIIFENSEILALGSNLYKTIAIIKSERAVSVKVISENNMKDIDTNKDSYENDVYILDFNKKRILLKKDISTVRQFKDNFEYDGYTVDLVNYLGKEISGSEKVGTGSTATFTKSGSETLKFTVISLNDITGEGSLNSKDLGVLYNYLLGKTELTEEVLIAADATMDGKVDVVDLLALDKILKQNSKN